MAGCAASPKAPKRIETPAEAHARTGERIAADPVAFLREVDERVSRLRQYRLTFYRQERTGLPPRLGPMEEIRAAFRQEPFSVKFNWDSPDMPYYESVYVQGRDDNLLAVRERKGILPFVPPQVRNMDVMLPVKIGKSKNPITDFGLRRMMERTLLPFNIPEIARVMTIRYEGVVGLEPIYRPVFYLRVDRPAGKGMNYARQDLYIDAETLLPAGTDLYLPGDILDVRYRYAHVDPNVQLTDADFRLSPAPPASRPARASAK
ncbi:MAG: DUF1571 domain-containing protein [Planctomycetes bacterium]|nr:DUF1571 domain-containing protein [Planctomycetota bacterium]